MSELDIDDKTRAALGRLTAGERECLERRLRHQTAKEIALELGVSPHAVEKRLKMARAKLGLSSSLQVARLLAAAGEYQQTGPQPPDLAATEPEPHKRRRVLVLGVLVMSLLAAALVVLAVQAPSSAGVAPLESGGVTARQADSAAPPPSAAAGTLRPGHRKASWDETAAFLSQGFDAMDKDHSGFLEPVEVSFLEPRNAYRDRSLPPAPPAGERDPAAEAKWTAKMDNDRDDLVSRHEYVEYMIPWMLYQGIPEDWQAPSPAAG